MGRPIDPQKLTNIQETIKKFHNSNTMSEIARMLQISPSSVRHHGRNVYFPKTLLKRKKVLKQGEFFTNFSGENWLV